MSITTSADTAAANRRRGSAADGVTFWHTLFIGTSRYNMAPDEPDPSPDALFPMAFLVEQDPASTTSAHYHQQDQFQVVVRGQGTLGVHEVRPLTVHFTGAFTAYGPIRASETEGVHYFTLRNGFDPGARFMARPENRTRLRSLPGRRHRESVAGPLASPQIEAEPILGPEPDGMGAWRFRLGPGEQASGPDPATGRGQYWLVVSGAMLKDDVALPEQSCSFVFPDEAPFVAVAGPSGLEVLAMQFPRHAGRAPG
jgi:hypothetical protein